MRLARFFGPVVIFASLAGALPAAAQADWRIGLRGGVNVGDQDVTVGIPIDASPSEENGLVIGASAEARWNDHLAFQLDVLYVERKTTFRFSETGGLPPITADYTIEYIDVPWVAKWNILRDPFIPALFVGFDMMFRLDANATARVGQASRTDDVKDQIESYNLGIVFGASIAWRFGEKGLWYFLLDGRYIHGVRNIAVTRDDWTTRDVQVTAGLARAF